MAPPINMKDIQNSPLNKDRQEISSKNLTFSNGETIKPLSIKIDKTVNGPDGSKTTFTVSMEHTFTTAQELKAVLDAVGYCGGKSMWEKVKGMVRKE